MELDDLKILAISLICLIVGGYLFQRNLKKLKATEKRDMVWTYTVAIFLDSIIAIGIGVTGIIHLAIKLFKMF